MVAYVAPGITQAIPWVTKEAGIFAKHGVDADVILLTGSPRLIQTLLAGDIDYAVGGVASVLRARIRGADPVIVATTANYSSQRVLIRPDWPFQRLQDLKGKTVGVTQYGSQGDTFFRDALKKNGLNPDADVTIIQMGGTPQVGSALVAGKIDAGVTGESGLAPRPTRSSETTSRWQRQRAQGSRIGRYGQYDTDSYRAGPGWSNQISARLRRRRALL